MNDRLEEFKDYIDFLDDSQDMQDHSRFVDTFISMYEDNMIHGIYRYAKEQAEQVEELSNWQDLHKADTIKLDNQNKRYRELLVEIEEGTNHYELAKRIRQILSEEE